ncbi:MAG: helix-turn-helix domain-containing protein [Butyricicoccus sp.]
MDNGTLGKILRQLRLENGYSEEEIAQYFGGDAEMVLRWEQDVCEPTASQCVILSELYGTTADSMLGGIPVEHSMPEDMQQRYRQIQWANRLAGRKAG